MSDPSTTPRAVHPPSVRARAWACAGALALLVGSVLIPPSVAALASSGADLCAQVGYNAGFRGNGLLIAVEVGMAESGCVASKTSPPNSDGTVDRGLWQINSVAHREVSNSCAYDAQCNADAAYQISSGGSSWSQWSTYNDGSYRNFATVSQAAITRLNVGAHPDVIVDDKSGGFHKYGPPYWYDCTCGYLNHSFWTNTGVSVIEDYAYWNVTIPSTGRWRAFAYIPAYHGTTANATYISSMSIGGGSGVAHVNQLPISNWWAPLSIWNISAGTGAQVYMGDATGEATTHQIAFDAVIWGWVYP
jgi:hypothetical protein